MKFGFYTDAHFSGQTPKHRVDDYQDALIAKLEEIYATAKSEDADFMVGCGDFFDSHRIFNYELLTSIVDIICDSGIHTYFIVGQHEIYGYNPHTYKSSTLSFLVNICSGLEIVWEPIRVGDVKLYPSHVWEDPKDASRFALDDDAVNILLAHHLLTNKKTMFETVNTGDFAKWMREGGADYDMVLSGDLHDGYDLHEVDGMWFCNPGSLARRAINDIKRKPQFVMIEAEYGEIPIIDVRHVKCAQKGEEVFGETAAEVMRNSTKFDPTAFVREIEEFEVESADIHELVQKVGSAKGIRKEVLDYISTKSLKIS